MGSTPLKPCPFCGGTVRFHSAGDEPIRYWFIGDVGQEVGQRHCKKSSHDGSLALFESENDAERAARRHPGTEVYLVEYYLKPQARAALSAPSHGGGVAHTDCRSEDGITVGLIDSIITSCRVLSSRDLTCEAVVEALRDLQSDSDVSLIKPSHSEQVRAVPVKLLRSLLADLESGMMCNPDHGELSQLRELIGEQDHGI